MGILVAAISMPILLIHIVTSCFQQHCLIVPGDTKGSHALLSNLILEVIVHTHLRVHCWVSLTRAKEFCVAPLQPSSRGLLLMNSPQYPRAFLLVYGFIAQAWSKFHVHAFITVWRR